MDLLMLRIKPGTSQILENIVTIWFFAATYDVRFENGNFYPFEVKDFVVKSGDNVYDFKVIPYIRVKSPKVEKNGNVITATFSLEAGKQEVKLKGDSAICFFRYVGR